MRLHRFYISEPIVGLTFDISNRDLISQWRNVFRYNVGSQVILFDGSGTDYLCIISSLRNLGATVSVIKKMTNNPVPKKNVWLCVGLIKKDNFELVVQKATELGITAIIPVLCDRSEKKNINMKRLQKIAIEASEQSGRGGLPYIDDVVELSDLLESDMLPEEKMVLDQNGRYIADFLSDKNPKDLAVFIGPEGGWSDREMKELAFHNIANVSLGPQTLRAETAAIAISSLLLL